MAEGDVFLAVTHWLGFSCHIGTVVFLLSENASIIWCMYVPSRVL